MNKSIFAYIASALGFIAVPAPKAITGAYTLTAADNNGTITYTGAGHTVTVPKDLPAGFSCKVVQGGAGAATIAGAAGVTVASVSDYVKTSGQDAMVEITNTAADKYVLTGEGAAAA